MRAASTGLVFFCSPVKHELGGWRTDSGQLVIGGERDEFDGNVRDRGPIGLEAFAQLVERADAGVKIGVDRLCELKFAGAVMREREQSNHNAAGLLLALG